MQVRHVLRAYNARTQSLVHQRGVDSQSLLFRHIKEPLPVYVNLLHTCVGSKNNHLAVITQMGFEQSVASWCQVGIQHVAAFLHHSSMTKLVNVCTYSTKTERVFVWFKVLCDCEVCHFISPDCLRGHLIMIDPVVNTYCLSVTGNP